MTQILLAILPVMMHMQNFQEAFFIGVLTAVALCLTTLFVRMATPLFKGKLAGLAGMLWMSALGVTAYRLWGVPPLWIVSLFILMENGRGAVSAPSLGRGNPAPTMSILFWRTFGFSLLTAFLGISHEILGTLGIKIFQPSGTLFLLALVSFLQGQVQKYGPVPETRDL